MKNYHEDINEGYILEVDIEYPKNFLNLHGDLPFLAERKKIKKCNKLFCSINKLCCSHKLSKTIIKSSTKYQVTKKSY